MQSILAISPLSPPLFEGGVEVPSSPEGAFLASFEIEGTLPADLAAEAPQVVLWALPVTLAAAVPRAALEGANEAEGQEVGALEVALAAAESADLAPATPVRTAGSGAPSAEAAAVLALPDTGAVAGVGSDKLAVPDLTGAKELLPQDAGPAAQGLAQRSGVATAASGAVDSQLPGQPVSAAVRQAAAADADGGWAVGTTADRVPTGRGLAGGDEVAKPGGGPMVSLDRPAGDKAAPRSDRHAGPGQRQATEPGSEAAGERAAAAGRPETSAGQRWTATAKGAEVPRPASERVEQAVPTPGRTTGTVALATPTPSPAQPVADPQAVETAIDLPFTPSGAEQSTEVAQTLSTDTDLVAPPPGAGFWERIFPSLAVPLPVTAAERLTPGMLAVSNGAPPDPEEGLEPDPTISAPEMPALSETARRMVPTTATPAPPVLSDAVAGLALDADPLLDPTAEDALAVLTAPVGHPAATSSAAPGLAASLPVPQVATQITAALARSADGATELALSPEELGHVRLRLEPDAANPDRMVVMITFERPETLDLFRRHAGDLAEALRAAGYAGADIGFGQEGSGAGGFGRAPDRGAAPDRLDPAPPIPPAPRLAAGASLDLRL